MALFLLFAACDGAGSLAGDRDKLWQEVKESQTYKVSFVTNGGTPSPKEQNIAKGGKVTQPTVTRTSYTLEGWYKESTFAVKWNFETDVVNGNITLYARWNSVSVGQCTVKFVTNSGAPIPDLSVPAGGKVTAQTTTREGYTFAGWYLDSDCTDSYNMDSAVTKDFTLYAKWTINKYTITFNINGGTGSVSPDTQDYNTDITLPVGSGLSRTGYTFLCWNTSSEGTGDDKNAGASYTIIGSETLFAKWKAITYKVVYHKNDDNAEGEMADTVHTYDVPQNLTLNGYELSGFSFVEWTKNSNGTGDTFTNGKEVENLAAVQDAVVDLYAKWSNITYKVAFDTNGGGSVPEQTVAQGGTAIRPASNPTKSGYTFDDWYNADLTTKYDFSAPVMSGITIYAKWGYTVTFNSNGGSYVAPQLVYEGEQAIRPSPDPNWEGYTFVNWYTDTTFAATYQFSNPVYSHTSIVARWIPAYTVNYDANGAEGDMEPTIHTVGIAKELSANTFTRTGCTFAGWAESAAGSVVYADEENVTNLRTSAGASITLYAKWVCTVTFDADGGSLAPVSPITKDYGSTVAQPSAMTKTGYTFDKWYTDALRSVPAVFPITVRANIDLYAKWMPDIAGMVWIPAGTFTMGQTGVWGSEPEHTVTLTQGFYMGIYQVTQEQWTVVMGTNPSFHKSVADPGEIQEKRPVDSVTWYDVIVFCNKLSMAEGLRPAYSISGSTNPAEWGTMPTTWDDPLAETWDTVQMVEGTNGYRLPTEAQWEYACRAGTTTLWYTGDTEDAALQEAAWYNANANNKTHEVGKKTPNAWGLYDMHVNVYEWCWDCEEEYSSATQIDPVGAFSGFDYFRVLRGGYWWYTANFMRSASRRSDIPSYRHSGNGVRIARPGE